MNFNASVILSEAWEYAKKHFLMMGLFMLVIYVITSFIQGILSVGSQAELNEIVKSEDINKMLDYYAAQGPALTISSLIASIASIGVLATALNIVLGKKDKVDFSGFQMPFEQWVKLICAEILSDVIIYIGIFCCIIPGLIFSARLLLVKPIIMANPNIPFFDAFKQSWAMTKGQTMSLLWLGFLIVVINFIGLCCCCVGLLFTAPLTYFAQSVVFVALNEKMNVQYNTQNEN